MSNIQFTPQDDTILKQMLDKIEGISNVRSNAIEGYCPYCTFKTLEPLWELGWNNKLYQMCFLCCYDFADSCIDEDAPVPDSKQEKQD